MTEGLNHPFGVCTFPLQETDYSVQGGATTADGVPDLTCKTQYFHAASSSPVPRV
jgi:hypothetical protein